LLYVALTRAKHRCSVVWGPFKGIDKSAFGYLLHQADRPKGKKDLVESTEARIKTLDDTAIYEDLERFAGEAEGSVEVIDLPLLGETPHPEEQEQLDALECRIATRRLELTSRTSSFSRLVAAAEPLSQPAEEGIDYDEAHVSADVPVVVFNAIPLNDFPAGARPGQLLHDILEHLDFTAASTTEARELVAGMLGQYGVEETWVDPVHAAIGDVVATPLDESPEPLCLQLIASSRRLSELQFLFPVAKAWTTDTARLTSGALADAFAREGRRPIPEDYARHIRDLGFAPLAGYLTGFIDLVFENDGLWYLVDYKSNHLGPRADDYAPARLIDEMARHHYFLQYHLYAVALHRYLALRLGEYDYDRHFGGVYYLFLRGMAPRHPFRRGVFYDRPSRALIETLSECMASPFGGPGSA
jgi:exodeoxyribonuclease V beta subunit